MSIGKLEVGDLILTRTYTGDESVEICQYRGATGSLMYMVYHPEAILKYNQERFVKDIDSQQASVRIVRMSNADAWAEVMMRTAKSLQAGNVVV